MLRVYLKGCAGDLQGFVPDKEHSGIVTSGTCENTRLSFENGRWYVDLSDCSDSPPKFLTEIVDEVSLYTSLPREIKRELGVYKHFSAVANLEPELAGGKWWAKLRIRAKKMEHLHELLRLIKTGAIRPVESYECPQAGLSRQQLEAQNEEFKSRAELWMEEARRLAENLRGYYDELGTGGSFFLRRNSIMKKIARILYPPGEKA